MQIGCRGILELCRSKRNTAADRKVLALEMCALLIRHRNAAEFYAYAVHWVRLETELFSFSNYTAAQNSAN